MKKITLLSIVALASLTLIACSSEKNQKSNTSEPKKEKISKKSEKESQKPAQDVKQQSKSSSETPQESSTDIQQVEQQSETSSETSQETSTDTQQLDLDEEAILNGDFTTLVGTWKAGNGNILVINSDKSASINEEPHAITIDSADGTQKYLSIRKATGVARSGAAIEMLKIGELNKYGDQSDTSKPRLLLLQGGFNSPAADYFYRN